MIWVNRGEDMRPASASWQVRRNPGQGPQQETPDPVTAGLLRLGDRRPSRL